MYSDTGISSKAMGVMTSDVNDIFERIAAFTFSLLQQEVNCESLWGFYSQASHPSTQFQNELKLLPAVTIVDFFFEK